LRHNALSAWETMQKSGGWKRCSPKWWWRSISHRRFPCANKKPRLAMEWCLFSARYWMAFRRD
jgi:hypothetical protein